MKIGILGTRGIPNAYGGFEQFAQHLSEGLVKKGHRVWVYSSRLHTYQEPEWNGVSIIHCKDWENKLGTAGQFIYDYNCFTDARQRHFDVLLHLGYTSSSVWWYRWPDTVNIVNMDGLEWKRTKYNLATQKFLRFAEQLAARNADVLVADSPGIQEYLLNRYNTSSVYIPYGAPYNPSVHTETIHSFGLEPYQYCLVIARFEPENNIEMIIKGYLSSSKEHSLVIIGNTGNAYGKKLVDQYSEKGIRFLGAIYNPDALNSIRHFSSLYFHGHSVGGTNPSLLEAMGCQCLVAAHDNVFNRAILENDGLYFSSVQDVTNILENDISDSERQRRKNNNLQRIREHFSWNRVIDNYENLFLSSVENFRKKIIL